MLKKTITYVDYNGISHEEDFWFNLTKTELSMMDFSVAGGMKQRLERVVKSNDTPTLMKEFREILKASYGVKSDDGKRFMKSDEIFTEFEQSPAYDILFMELINNPEAAAEFAHNVIPPDLAKEVDEEMKDNVSSLPPTGAKVPMPDHK